MTEQELHDYYYAKLSPYERVIYDSYKVLSRKRMLEGLVAQAA